MSDLEWFNYWNSRLWEAVKNGDQQAEDKAIAYLYCKPMPPTERMDLTPNE